MKKLNQKQCQTCDKLYARKKRRSFKWWLGSKYCSRECQFISMKGRKPYRMTDEIRKKISKANNIRFQDPNEREKISRALLGSKSPAWKGGITPLKKQIYRNSRYKNWVKSVLLRDNFICQECGIREVYLEAHHKKSFMDLVREYKIKTLLQAISCEELWNINNGVTLCRVCHSLTSGYKGRKEFARQKRKKRLEKNNKLTNPKGE